MKCIHSATNINLKNIVILLYVKLKKKMLCFQAQKVYKLKLVLIDERNIEYNYKVNNNHNFCL